MQSRSPRSRELLDAVVVGAGMVGAAAALGLARLGWRVALIEPEPVLPPIATEPVDLRVVALAPHAIALLQRLGVWPAMAALRVSPYRRMEVCDAQQQASIQFAAVDYGWSELGCIVENRLVAGCLWQALQSTPGLRLLAGARLSGLQRQSEGWRVDLEDGLALQARLLIAADGARSAVRERLLIEVDSHDYRQSALVAHLEPERAHRETAWQRFLPSGPLALLPLADGRVSMVWSLPSASAASLLQVSDEELALRLKEASAGHFGALRPASARAAFPLRRQIARRFCAGNALLIGDAAHVVHPLAGQGVNLGFEDVEALLAAADKAREQGETRLGGSALQRLARSRRSESTLAAHAFESLNRLFRDAEGPLVLARGIGLKLVDRLTPLKRHLAERAAGLRAGGAYEGTSALTGGHESTRARGHVEQGS